MKVGQVKFTNELKIENITLADGATEIDVLISPGTDKTVADKNYPVVLRLDGNQVGSQNVSFSAPEIAAGTKKTIKFTGINLSGVSLIEVEIGG